MSSEYELSYDPASLDSIKCASASFLGQRKVLLKPIAPSLPCLTLPNGVKITCPKSICLLLSDTLLSDDVKRSSSISQWLEFSTDQLRSLRGVGQKDFPAKEKGKSEAFLLETLQNLNQFLEEKTYLVGERLSVADIFLAADIIPILAHLKDECRPLKHLMRWHRTVLSTKALQPLLQAKEITSQAKTSSSQGQRLKLLCLHGYRQDGTSFRAKTGAFRKMLGKKAEFHYANAPHLIPRDPEVRLHLAFIPLILVFLERSRLVV